MSETEAHTGKITPIDLENKTLDEWIQNKLDTTELEEYYENWIEALEDAFYEDFYYDPNSEILYKIESEELDPENILEMTKNSDGSYNFTISYYNGGASFDEVLQWGIQEVEKPNNGKRYD